MYSEEQYKALQQEIERLRLENQSLVEEKQQTQESGKQTFTNRYAWGRWWTNTVVAFWLGGNAKQSFEKLGKEIKDNPTRLPNPETITVTAYHLFWRFIRVSVISWVTIIATLSFIGFELWILLNQNALLKEQNRFVNKQNELLEKQNVFVSEQTKLLANQNKFVGEQTDLLKRQNTFVEMQTNLFSKQNELVAQQNAVAMEQSGLFKAQNRLVTQQNLLSEASRRSSLVLLISNIEDRIAEELRLEDNKKRQLSDALVGRIVALCNSLKPYKYLENDSLTKEISPERGQLLISLVNAKLDTLTYNKIFENANFNYADLKEANLKSSYLLKINLRYANLLRANLSQAVLFNSDLSYACLDYANFEHTDLRYSDMVFASMQETKFNDASMSFCSLFGAVLKSTKFSYTDLQYADFRNVEVSKLLITTCFVDKDNPLHGEEKNVYKPPFRFYEIHLEDDKNKRFFHEENIPLSYKYPLNKHRDKLTYKKRQLNKCYTNISNAIFNDISILNETYEHLKKHEGKYDIIIFNFEKKEYTFEKGKYYYRAKLVVSN